MQPLDQATEIKTERKIRLKTELLKYIKELLANSDGIQLISLCTTDGFNIKTFATKSLSVEADKIAAMASTLSSLSSSAANQIMSDSCHTTTTETSNGHILFISTHYLKLPCILTVAVSLKMSLATARFTTVRLSKNIAEISDD